MHELLARQAAAPDGVVHLTTTSFGRLLAGKARPYTIVLFLTAEHLREKPALRLDFMREEFGHLAKAFKASVADSRAAGKLFFADVEFSESREARHLSNVSVLAFLADGEQEKAPELRHRHFQSHLALAGGSLPKITIG